MKHLIAGLSELREGMAKSTSDEWFLGRNHDEWGLMVSKARESDQKNSETDNF